MLTFKSPEDLSKLPASIILAHPLVKELIKELIEAYTWEDHPYNPDWYGYTILIEAGRRRPHPGRTLGRLRLC